MKSRMTNVTGGVVAVFFLAAACAGSKLNDIGDIDRNHAGSGGSGDTGSTGGTGNTGDTGNRDPANGGADDTDNGGPQVNGGSQATGGIQATGGTKGIVVGGSGNVHAGTGGTGDTEPPPIEYGGAGGAADEGLVCPDCELVAETPHIRAIASDSKSIYWLEYGNFDGLGNYQADGRLLSLAFDQTEPDVIATGLQGPAELAVTEDYAYFILEHSTSPKGEVQLARISLGGGDVELLQAIANSDTPHDRDGVRWEGLGWFNYYFASGGGFVFWRNADTIYRLMENADAPPVAFLTVTGKETVMADEAKLYVQNEAGISAVAHTGSQLAPLWAYANSLTLQSMVLSSEAFFAVEFDEKAYFTKVPKGGGARTRLGAPPTPSLTRLFTDGTSYVGDFSEYQLEPYRGLEPALREGKLTDPSSARTLATGSRWKDAQGTNWWSWRAWTATPTAVYLGHENQLYRVARQF